MAATESSARELKTGFAAQSRQRTVFFSLCFDILIWIPEIIAVIITGSITIFADVMKCGNEILATIFALMILLKMRKGGQFQYDYGMGKFETFTRITTGIVMLVSLLIICYFTIFRLIYPEPLHPEGALLSIPLMIFITAVDTYLWRKSSRIAKADPSPIMISQWRLRRSKSFADLCVLVSLILSFGLADQGWAIYIDPAASFIIMGFLLLAGFREITSSLPELFDKTLEEEFQILILRELTLSFDKYHEFYGVCSRRSGSNIYIDIFLGFDPAQTMGDVQDFIDTLKSSLEEKIPGSIVRIVPTKGGGHDRCLRL